VGHVIALAFLCRVTGSVTWSYGWKACEVKHAANFRRAGQLRLVDHLQLLGTDRDTDELEGILNLLTKYTIANK